MKEMTISKPVGVNRFTWTFVNPTPDEEIKLREITDYVNGKVIEKYRVQTFKEQDKRDSKLPPRTTYEEDAECESCRGSETYHSGTTQMKNKKVEVTFDVRVPGSWSTDKIVEVLRKKLFDPEHKIITVYEDKKETAVYKSGLRQPHQ